MTIKNFEFKAKVDELAVYENKLLQLNPIYQGLDHQRDTYFNVQKGRLKLREGNIENSLIQYDRENIKGSKKSDILLYRHEPDATLKSILTLQLGVKIVVDKKRRIYFLDNVKFHFDQVDNLGTFIEVEAIDLKGEMTTAALKQQCDHYFSFFELGKSSLVDRSYSDLMMDLNP